MQTREFSTEAFLLDWHTQLREGFRCTQCSHKKLWELGLYSWTLKQLYVYIMCTKRTEMRFPDVCVYFKRKFKAQLLYLLAVAGCKLVSCANAQRSTTRAVLRRQGVMKVTSGLCLRLLHANIIIENKETSKPLVQSTARLSALRLLFIFGTECIHFVGLWVIFSKRT